MRRHRAPQVQAQGFTLIETLIVLALMGILMMFGMPALLEMMKRERLVGAARQATTVFRLARSEAIKRNADVGVTVDYAGGRIFAFRDLPEADPPPDDVPNGEYDAGEPIVAEVTLPNGIGLFGPGDDIDGGAHANACVGFPESPADVGIVIFDGRGTASSTGAIRFTDQVGTDYLELRIETPATGRLAVQKYAGGDGADPDSWKEQGEDSYVWEFGVIRAGEGG